ncbi:MAG: hypothetical protein AB7G08_31640 [Hyphomicrobiaceae bacterium]
MTDRIALVQQYLTDLIRDADLEMSGRKSVLDFAARIRRSTAQDILDFMQSLSAEQRGRQADGAVVPFRPSSPPVSSSPR